jgi:hypothetical protein
VMVTAFLSSNTRQRLMHWQCFPMHFTYPAPFRAASAMKCHGRKQEVAIK